MPQIRMLADKVRLVSEPTDKFKTGCISVSMALPMDERMAANSLLVYLLKRSKLNHLFYERLDYRDARK
jgi:hypothetical protein